MEGAVIGIDAGGSKTRALAASLDGTILGAGQAGAANHQSVGQDAAFGALDEAIAQALASANLRPEDIRGACVGAAGLDRPADHALYQGWASRALPYARVKLVNDARIVLAAGTPADWGLVMICGTGSIAYCVAPGGEIGRAGGWGYLLGDEGSGYDIGLRALQAVMRSFDGRDAQTCMAAAVLAEWGLSSPVELVSKVYGGLPRSEIARISTLVEPCAETGDRKAAEILQWAGNELAAAAKAAVEHSGIQGAVPAALTGGVLLHGHMVRQALLDSALARGLRLEPVTLVSDPARGAVRLAIQAASG